MKIDISADLASYLRTVLEIREIEFNEDAEAACVSDPDELDFDLSYLESMLITIEQGGTGTLEVT